MRCYYHVDKNHCCCWYIFHSCHQHVDRWLTPSLPVPLLLWPGAWAAIILPWREIRIGTLWRCLTLRWCHPDSWHSAGSERERTLWAETQTDDGDLSPALGYLQDLLPLNCSKIPPERFSLLWWHHLPRTRWSSHRFGHTEWPLCFIFICSDYILTTV